MAQAYAQQIAELPPDQQQMALEAIGQQSPELAQLIQQLLGAMAGQQQQQGPQVDMRPLPEQLPPRREAAPV